MSEERSEQREQKILYVKLDPWLHEELMKRAASTGVSLSDLVRLLLMANYDKAIKLEVMTEKVK